MRRALESVLARYGQSVTVERRLSGERLEGRAFLQPLPGQRVPAAATPLGAVCLARWLYLGTEGVAPGDRVEQAGRVFVVEDARRIFWRDEVLYCRAVLTLGKEAWA